MQYRHGNSGFTAILIVISFIIVIPRYTLASFTVPFYSQGERRSGHLQLSGCGSNRVNAAASLRVCLLSSASLSSFNTVSTPFVPPQTSSLFIL